jgi:hypothetical protein
MLVRDVDKLDPLPDEKLRQLDEEYVVSMCRHVYVHDVQVGLGSNRG